MTGRETNDEVDGLARNRRGWAAWVLLAIQMVAMAFWLAGQGKLKPITVNDTAGYVAFPFDLLRGAFTSIRTPGYPLFLRATDALAADHAAVPTAQMACYFAAVGLLFAALRRWSGATWIALCAASSLLYANILVGYVETVATEVLAGALGIACGACVLFWSASPNRWRLIGVALVVTAGWMVRPGYAYLVMWAPLMGWWLVRSPGDVGKRSRAWMTLAVACVAPLVVYVGLRWSVTGDVGLASFDGYNLIGLAGQFVSEETVQTLSPERKGIVQAALQNRAGRKDHGFWHADEPPLHYLRMEFNHDDTIWKDYEPAARAVVGADTGTLNRELGGIAKDIIRRQPRDYGTWLVKASRQAAKKIAWDFLDNPVMLLLTIAGAALFVLARLKQPVDANPERSAGVSPLVALTVFFVTYAAMNVFCTIPFVPPRGRLMDGAAVWLPALVGAAFGTLCLSPRRRGLPPGGGA